MALHHIHKGLDLPIAGAPAQVIHDGPPISRVAALGDDVAGVRARLRVDVGDVVRRGQLLFEDGATPGVRYTAPAAGRVEAVHRGPRRALRSIVILRSDSERASAPAARELQAFESRPSGAPDDLDWLRLRDLLVESGAWTAFRTRPFSKVPVPDTRPSALFVTAIDTNPLAADPDVVLAERPEDFSLALRALTKLSGGPTYLCVRAGSSIPDRVDADVRVEEFSGPHPAGTAGVHIHTLAPVGRDRVVWTIGYQDVAAIGHLLRTGELDPVRVVAIAGPPVAEPRLVRTVVGADVTELTAGEAAGDGVRWISGSVLSGKAASGEAFSFMGRYDTQLCALAEGGERRFLAWLRLGLRSFSAFPVFASSLRRLEGLPMSTDAHGSARAIIPIGLYERVMPMDVLPTFLLRALAVGDVERAEELGCLELDEEDLALCSFVDPGKTDFGPLLRRNLDLIEQAG